MDIRVKFPPGYGYPSIKDWELKREEEERFQRWKRFWLTLFCKSSPKMPL
jgi:hypothetical protein